MATMKAMTRCILFLLVFALAPMVGAQTLTEADNARAHMLLAYSYRGYGESIDKDKCLFHFQKAAESGEPKALEELATAYSAGEAILPGLAKDQVEALKWYLIDPAAKSPKDPQVIVFDRTRDRLHQGLTETELAEAKSRAEAWLAKHPHLKTWGLRAEPLPPEKQSPEVKQIYEILQNDPSPGPD